MNYLLLPFYLLFIILSSNDVHGRKGNDWKLKKSEDGINVYIKDLPGSNFKEIKVTCTLNCSASSLVQAISHKEDFPKWIYACSEARLLKEVSPLETYHYQVTDAPWPVEDRDLIIQTNISQNQQSKVINIYGKGIADYSPTTPGKIRVPKYSAHWIITPKAKNVLDIEYLIALDPGGSLPAWIVNLGVTEGPFKTMKNLIERLPKYKDAKITYITEFE